MKDQNIQELINLYHAGKLTVVEKKLSNKLSRRKEDFSPSPD